MRSETSLFPQSAVTGRAPSTMLAKRSSVSADSARTSSPHRAAAAASGPLAGKQAILKQVNQRCDAGEIKRRKLDRKQGKPVGRHVDEIAEHVGNDFVDDFIRLEHDRGAVRPQRGHR